MSAFAGQRHNRGTSALRWQTAFDQMNCEWIAENRRSLAKQYRFCRTLGAKWDFPNIAESLYLVLNAKQQGPKHFRGPYVEKHSIAHMF